MATLAPAGAAGGCAPRPVASDRSALRTSDDGDDDATTDPRTTRALLSSTDDCPAVPFEELKLVSSIGKGAFADIYSANFRGEVVAVKILRDETTAAEERSPPSAAAAGVEDLQREIDVLRDTKHANLVNLIGVSETPKGQPSLILEHMDKGSLRDVYLQNGPLLGTLVRKVALSVAQGMALLHSKGILHRDLKAANILMDSSGGVKIADFGLARMKSKRIESHTCETGSYRWMAPEVISHRPYDEKADVYSFGILMWELLAGQVPYPSHSPIQAAVGVVHRALRPPVQLGVPNDLRKLMEACWHKNPNKRPSFLDVIRRLRDADVSSVMSGIKCFSFFQLPQTPASDAAKSSKSRSRLSKSVPRHYRASETDATTSYVANQAIKATLERTSRGRTFFGLTNSNP